MRWMPRWISVRVCVPRTPKPAEEWTRRKVSSAPFSDVRMPFFASGALPWCDMCVTQTFFRPFLLRIHQHNMQIRRRSSGCPFLQAHVLPKTQHIERHLGSLTTCCCCSSRDMHHYS